MDAKARMTRDSIGRDETVSNTKDQSRLQYGDFYRHHQRWTNQFYPYFGEPPSQKPYGERGQLDPELMAVIVQSRRSFH